MESNTNVKKQEIVSAEKWVEARKELLVKEKEFTKLRDKLSQQIQDLPWADVNSEYIFDTENGKQKLAELFDGKSQLIVYHFMFDPSWEEGCKSCSLFADNNVGGIIHLNNRDVSMVFVSKAPLDKLQEFKKRMKWDVKWVSSINNDFNRDFHVSFTPDEIKEGKTYYNYGLNVYATTEAHGISVFFKDKNRKIFHTYSSYGRGLDVLLGTYNLLDIVPKGRDEGKLQFTMDWIRHHDKYD